MADQEWPEPFKHQRTYRMAKKLTITFTMDYPGPDEEGRPQFTELTCEWNPGLPAVLTSKLEKRYILARNAFMNELADDFDLPCILFEV